MTDIFLLLSLSLSRTASCSPAPALVAFVVQGLNFPSTADCGSSGSFFKDFTWGTELYPRVFGVDIKRFINCRFSMTFWMLAGLSYSYKSFTLHGEVDYGLLLSAVSQYLYLVKVSQSVSQSINK